MTRVMKGFDLSLALLGLLALLWTLAPERSAGDWAAKGGPALVSPDDRHVQAKITDPDHTPPALLPVTLGVAVPPSTGIVIRIEQAPVRIGAARVWPEPRGPPAFS